jgi:hypothetical protein
VKPVAKCGVADLYDQLSDKFEHFVMKVAATGELGL